MFQKKIPFGTERRDLSIFFQSDRSEPVRTQFINHFTDRRYWLDNVSLERVQVTPVDPSERFMLVYNEFTSSQEFVLNGCWSDVNGELYTGSITVAPFSSVVLQKEPDTSCALTTGVDELNGASMLASLYPNPVRAGHQVHLSEALPASAKATLIDMTGRAVQESSLLAGATNIALGEHVGPGAYVLILRAGTEQQALRLVVE